MVTPLAPLMLVTRPCEETTEKRPKAAMATEAGLEYMLNSGVLI